MAKAYECQQWRDLERQALAEAEQHLPDITGLQQIREALDKARTDLGGEEARLHAIEFGPDSWKPDVSLPPAAVKSRRISRADAFDAAAQPADAEGNWRLFCTSFVFGYGTYGIGPSRMARILRRTPRVRLCFVIAEARKQLKQCGPLAAYDYLRGKVPHWGPAFFTKLLYHSGQSKSLGWSDRSLACGTSCSGAAGAYGGRHIVTGCT